ncbi:uncharacterized protein [Coffea arabica]|uniref:Uncharacterized protein n=1 Tax=Coffea arabica TaxID=13443 RepID=A0ABM4VUF7_COFAR
MVDATMHDYVNNEVSIPDSASKLKNGVSCFSTYEQGSSSGTHQKHTCSDYAIPYTAADSFICMSCYTFFPESIEQVAELSSLVTRYQTTRQFSGSTANKSGANRKSMLQKTQTVHKRTKRPTGTKNPDGIGALKFINDEPDILPSKPHCSYCEAKKFHSETPNFCCSEGEVVLQQNKLPDILIELYTGRSDEAASFRTYVRTYNNMFGFTSFGVHYDKSLCKRTNGIYTFKVQGQTYHFIKDLIPSGGSGLYLQLYFHDTEC